MKKKGLPVTNIGTVTLIMILIVLCMIIFATLSLVSAFNDTRSGRKMADHLTEYYAASNTAEEMLAIADDAFASAYQKTENEKEYYRYIHEELLSTPVETVWDGDELDVTFQVEINDSQALVVLLDVLSPQQVKGENSGSFYKILSWQVINTESWESDNTIQLIQ